VTIAVADAARAIEFLALGFCQERAVMIDDGIAAQYMGMPSMKANHLAFRVDDIKAVSEHLIATE